MSLKIGVCGAGAFARCFIPLFQAHPLVEEVALADVLPERMKEWVRIAREVADGVV